MDDLDNYIQKRKNAGPDFAQQFDEGYERFKIDILLQAREQAKQAGLTKKDIKAAIKKVRREK